MKCCAIIRRRIQVVSSASFRELKAQRTPQSAFAFLTTLPGIGAFNAYEIYSDLMYCDERYFGWGEDAWANPGPGCQRGLKIIWPGRTDYLALMRKLRDEQDAAFEKLGLDFRAIAPPGKERLIMRSIEHWCCEFQKYERGNTKRTFVPITSAEGLA